MVHAYTYRECIIHTTMYFDSLMLQLYYDYDMGTFFTTDTCMYCTFILSQNFLIYRLELQSLCHRGGSSIYPADPGPAQHHYQLPVE